MEDNPTDTNIEVTVTPYDNPVTLLYKWADVHGVPTKLIAYSKDAKSNEIKFYSVYELVKDMVDQQRQSDEIWRTIQEFNTAAQVEDVFMLYYMVARKFYPKEELYQYMNQVRREMEESTEDIYSSNEDLKYAYTAWNAEMNRLKTSEEERIETIYQIQQNLYAVDQSDQQKIQFSPVEISSTIVSFTPKIQGIAVTPSDGIDIFNDSVTSKYIPYIRYNDKYGKAYTRVYKGDKAENEPNYSMTILPLSDTEDPNTIYMTLWLGDDNSELRGAVQKSFSTVVYHLDTNFLTVKVPIGVNPKKGLITQEYEAFRRAQEALPTIDFGEGSEVKVQGKFDMWGFNFDESTLLDFILNDPVLNVYLYVEENITPFALKERLDIHYRTIYSDLGSKDRPSEDAYISNFASVSITMSPKVNNEPKIIELWNPNDNTVTQHEIPAGYNYIHVNITQAENKPVVYSFMPIFGLLMQYYTMVSQDLVNEYYTLLPQLGRLPDLIGRKKRKLIPQDTDLVGISSKKTSNKKQTKIKSLQDAAPDLFVTNYARKCQCGVQPIIVSDDEADLWRNRRFGPFQIERQIMPFPKDNPRWNFVCPNDDNPYPGVKINDILSNSHIYPYIPCCFKRDQMRAGANSKYRAYIENREITHTGAKAENKIATRKYIEPDKIAYLPRAVRELLQSYSPNSVDLVRYGVIRSPNSTLHCICVALDYGDYLNLETIDEKEQFVINLRNNIANYVNPSLLKQEMYDYTDLEIFKDLSDSNKFLDPSLFYRALEEFFSVNLYVFSPSAPSADEKELGYMSVPRFKIYPARSLRKNRPCIVLIRNQGSESDALKYPQCELVVDNRDTELVKFFGSEMTAICHDALQTTIKTMTWSVIPVEESAIFDVHSNIYYHIDHLDLFQPIGNAVSQFIDNNGKLRALTYQLDNDQLITIATIPSQPENLPESTHFGRVPLETAIEIFGQPTAVTRNIHGLVDGAWFRIMDIKYGEYVFVDPVRDYPDYPTGPDNPIFSIRQNVTQRLSVLRRTLNIIVQIVRWLYDIYRTTATNSDVDTFARNYMLTNTKNVPDSSTYYDLTRIPRKYPLAYTVTEAINQLSPFAPTLFQNGKIVMYSPSFAKRIMNMLSDYENLDSSDILPVYIEGYYENETDFKSVPDSQIFVNINDLKAWMDTLKTVKNYSKFYNVRTKIDSKISFNMDPYIYKDDDGKIYIIQNVVGGHLAKALNIANTWYNHRINLGSNVPPIKAQPVHMIYGISSSSTIIPIKDRTQGSDAYLEILYYGSQNDINIGKEGRYAAMLEIL